MFDRSFFETDLPEQIIAMGAGNVTATITLLTGVQYNIRRILRPSDLLVWLEVFPLVGMTPDERKKRVDTVAGDVRHDRIAVLYSTISLVALSAADNELSEEQGMGYHAILPKGS